MSQSITRIGAKMNHWWYIRLESCHFQKGKEVVNSKSVNNLAPKSLVHSSANPLLMFLSLVAEGCCRQSFCGASSGSQISKTNKSMRRPWPWFQAQQWLWLNNCQVLLKNGIRGKHLENMNWTRETNQQGFHSQISGGLTMWPPSACATLGDIAPLGPRRAAERSRPWGQTHLLGLDMAGWVAWMLGTWMCFCLTDLILAGFQSLPLDESKVRTLTGHPRVTYIVFRFFRQSWRLRLKEVSLWPVATTVCIDLEAPPQKPCKRSLKCDTTIRLICKFVLYCHSYKSMAMPVTCCHEAWQSLHISLHEPSQALRQNWKHAGGPNDADCSLPAAKALPLQGKYFCTI